MFPQFSSINTELILSINMCGLDHVALKSDSTHHLNIFGQRMFVNKGNNKITELRTILQREGQNS
jgi:hypothetical protein